MKYQTNVDDFNAIPRQPSPDAVPNGTREGAVSCRRPHHALKICYRPERFRQAISATDCMEPVNVPMIPKYAPQGAAPAGPPGGQLCLNTAAVASGWPGHSSCQHVREQAMPGARLVRAATGGDIQVHIYRYAKPIQTAPKVYRGMESTGTVAITAGRIGPGGHLLNTAATTRQDSARDHHLRACPKRMTCNEARSENTRMHLSPAVKVPNKTAGGRGTGHWNRSDGLREFEGKRTLEAPPALSAGNIGI
ncbi:hypothetical protein BKA93DRAFT_752658 [Sparassis latifolia]